MFYTSSQSGTLCEPSELLLYTAALHKETPFAAVLEAGDRRRPTEGLQENGILDLRNHTVGVGCTFELIVFSLTSLLSHCS